MLKPLTFSVSLALALGATTLGYAGGHGGKSLPSPQGVVASPQAVVASPQSCDTGVADACGPVEKHCGLFDMFKPREKCYTYEWVLKKKKVHNFKMPKLFGGHKGLGGLCGGDECGGCDACAAAPATYPSAQWASPQGAPAPSAQIYGTGQATYAAGQATYGTGQIGSGQAVPTATPAPTGDAAPAPEAAPTPDAAPPADANPETASLMFLPSGN